MKWFGLLVFCISMPEPLQCYNKCPGEIQQYPIVGMVDD